MSKWKVKRDEEPTFVPKKNKDKDKNKNKSKEKALKEKERELKKREAEIKKRENELNNNFSSETCDNIDNNNDSSTDTNETSTINKYFEKAGIFKNKKKKDTKEVKLKIRTYIGAFMSALISPRKGNLSRLHFIEYLFILIMASCILLLLTIGSGIFQLIIILFFIIFTINLICQRYKKIGLKWFMPIIATILSCFSIFVSSGIIITVAATTGADADTYSTVINFATLLEDSLGQDVAVAIIFLGISTILYLIFLLFSFVLCFLNDGACRRGKVMGIIYTIVMIISILSVPTASYSVMNATNNTIDLATNIVYKSLFTQQEDGTYLINGTFISGTDSSNFNEVVNYYNAEQTAQDVIDDYTKKLSYMTLYNDDLRISSIMGQNVTKGDKVVGVLELGVINVEDEINNNKFIIEDITVGGNKIIVKQEYQLNNKINFLMIEVPPLVNEEEVLITTIYNGETKILRAYLIDLTGSLQSTQEGNEEKTESENIQ